VPAYFVVELEITNQAAMEPYRAAVGATITQYGGLIGVRLGLIINVSMGVFVLRSAHVSWPRDRQPVLMTRSFS
jgi:uncharacterized protein (DUF1330 family)